MKKLGFGCMRLPLLDKSDNKSIDIEQVKKMLDFFIENGFTYFDTAYMYHDHQSESTVKKVLVDRYPRDKFLLATKLPTMNLKEKGDVERIFNEQLEKTGAGYFDYYLMHCLDRELYPVLERCGGFEFGMKMKKQGKIKKLGFSFHDTADVLDKILTEHPEAEFVQLQINYLDWEDEKIQSKKCYEVALKHNKEIIIMEPVKGGTLANVPKKAEELFKNANPNMSVPSWAVRFAAGLDNVIMVLSGMSSIEQITDNVGYMKNFVPLSDKEKDICFKVAEIIKKPKSIPCTACRYCTEGCPKNIPIPDYFSLYNELINENYKDLDDVNQRYTDLTQKFGKIDSCIECKQCEEHCPQHIEITSSLKTVLNKFEK